MEAISDYGMDVKPSLKYTPSKPALGVVRHCYREAFTVFRGDRNFHSNPVGCNLTLLKTCDYRDFPIIIMKVKLSLLGC